MNVWGMAACTIQSLLPDLVPAIALVGAALWCCQMAAGAEPAGPEPGAATTDTFFVIPHTHWEGAVFFTRQEYLEQGLPYIKQALKLLQAYPGYRFVLDQACYVKPFLERYPQEEAAFRKFIAEGRLAICGGLDVMPDVNMPGGESFVRQVLYGKGYFRRKLGIDVTISWQLDTFGHHAQMPQLLKLAGYKSFWFFRGVPDLNTSSEFLWEGLDGSRIPAFWLPYGYSEAYGSPKSLPEFTKFFRERFNALTRFTRGPGRVVLAGADVAAPEEHLPPMVEEFNRQADAPFHLRLALPADYEAAKAGNPDKPVLKGELNPIFQGTYSSRIELKQRVRELERLLTTAEKLGVLLRWLGETVDDEVLWQAWEPMLFNQTHDMMSGVMTDIVYEDTIRAFDLSKRMSEDEVRARLKSVASRIDTRGEGVALVVLSALAWPRTDVATAAIDFAAGEASAIRLLGPDGRPVPVQVLDSRRHADGSLRQAEIAFVARDIPAMGYSVYRLVALKSPAAAPPAAAPPDGIIENEHYQVKFDPATGAITALIVKGDNWNALSGPANVVAREEDHGDLWEPYRLLDGGSRIAMKDRHPAPGPGKAVFSTDQAGAPGAVCRGPVVSEFAVSHAFGEKGRFSTRVRLYAGLRRIDIRTSILNQEKFVRYRVLFPTSIAKGQGVHEIPFGASPNGDAIEFPAQNWLDYGDGARGVALLNRGLPGNNVAGGTMMLSLARSTYLFGYNFNRASDSGFELGKELTFDYAIVPHAGDWRQAGVYRDGMEFNDPLVVCAEVPHAGVLPSRWGFLEISRASVVVSAMKGGPNGTAVLRLYEAAGQRADAVKIKLAARVVSAEEVNLMEDPGTKLKVAADTLRLDLRPFEVKTIKLELARHGAPGK